MKKRLLIINRERSYIIDHWEIKKEFKDNKVISIISGMDIVGMYFQIKINRLVEVEEIKDFYLLIV